MRLRRLLLRFTAAAGLLFLTGSNSACGFIFSHAPPDGHERMDYFTCTESNTAPIMDVVWGGLIVLGVLTVVGDPGAVEEPGRTIAIGLTWAGLSGAAATVGFTRS